ncbi:MAG: hypothetical protein ACRDSH_22450 [Pseudonocardiaceae bacterium]
MCWLVGGMVVSAMSGITAGCCVWFFGVLAAPGVGRRTCCCRCWFWLVARMWWR